jgi:hypothetical protein
MCLQGEETKIDVKNIEKEFQFHGLQAANHQQNIGEIWDHQKLEQRNNNMTNLQYKICFYLA